MSTNITALRSLLFNLTVLSMFFPGCKHVPPANLNAPCRDILAEYTNATVDLGKIYQDDQQDREGFQQFDEKDLERISRRDEQRRIKVSQLFARGCLKAADDYKKAAMIFQHGNAPDHFYQAFVWARTALRLGDESAQHLLNLSLDRFLVRSGYKQLFGSQAAKGDGQCWCLYPIEASFTDEERKARDAKSLQEHKAWLNTLNALENCPVLECAMELKPVKQGEFPEFW